MLATYGEEWEAYNIKDVDKLSLIVLNYGNTALSPVSFLLRLSTGADDRPDQPSSTHSIVLGLANEHHTCNRKQCPIFFISL